MSPSKYAKARDRTAKRDARRAQHEALGDDYEQGEYKLPDRSECLSDGAFMVAPCDKTRLFFVPFTQDSRFVDIVGLHFVQLEDGGEDGWYMLARVDCKHGHMHLHLDDKGASRRNVTHLRKLDAVDDVEEGYDDAYSAIFDDWEERERRFRNEWQPGSKRNRPTQRLPQAGSPPDCD